MSSIGFVFVFVLGAGREYQPLTFAEAIPRIAQLFKFEG
ncbi:hypothetical protein VAR608DRAFT_0303 [Variovorax sp. HW608]|nr:hypothetical protein VAR608DRAFT_0303 [Variovorax sp. HW608]